MKKLFTFLILFALAISSAVGGDLKFNIYFFPTELHFGNETEVEIEFENIHQMFPVQQIQFQLTVRRTSDQEIMYQDSRQLQELPPQQKHIVNFGPLDYQQLDEDEEYILEVGTQQEFDENPTNNNGEHLFYLLPPFDRDWVQAHVATMLEDNYTPEELANTHAYVGDEMMPIGTELVTFDQEDFSTTLENDSWLVFIDWDIYGKYAKPVTYMLVTEGQDDIFHDVQWYPYVDDQLWIPDPFSSDQLIFGEPAEFISEIPPIDFSQPVPTVKKDSVCAIIVTGKDSVLQSALDEDKKWIRYMLQQNGLGEELSDDNIKVLDKGTKAEIKAAIEELKKKYKKVYFYYTGHGSKNGKMCTNDESSEWMTYDELFQELFGTDAEEIVVIIDACYSGKAIKSAEDNDNKKGKKVTVLTSSDSNKVSRVEWLKSSIDTTKKYCESIFSRALVLCAEDSLANTNKDTVVSAKEAFDWAKARDTAMSNRQNPQGMLVDTRFNLFNLKLVVQQYFDENYSSVDLTNTVAQPYPFLLPEGTVIETFDTEDFSMTLENDSYLILVDWDIYAKYSKPVTFMLFSDLEAQPIVEDVFWFPVIDGTPWNFDPLAIPTPDPFGLDPFFVGGPPLLPPLPIPPLDITQPPVPTVPQDSVCAIIVTGDDSTMQTAFDNDRSWIKWFLQQNDVGEQLGDDNVEVLNKATKAEIIAAIKKLKENYSKIYFFYAGHGSKDGEICTKDSSKYWLTYQELFKELYCTKAGEITVVLDACYSGLAIDAAKKDTTRGDRKVNVFTASDSTKTARNVWYIDSEDTTKRYCYGYFTRNLVLCSTDTLANTNKDTIISFEEAFDWVRKQNPTFINDSINERQNPQKFVEDTRDTNELDIEKIIRDLVTPIYEQGPPGGVVFWDPVPLPPDWTFYPIHEPELLLPPYPTDTYYGWIDLFPGAMYEHETILFSYNPETEEFNTQPALWYPVAADPLGDLIFLDYKVLLGEEPVYIDDTPESTISEVGESEAQDQVCAILVSGTDKRPARREDIHRQQTTYECNIEEFKKELTTEKLGPKLEEKDVQLFKGIGKDSLCTILEGMVGKYKKVYFYYSGHGSKSGKMCLGDSTSDWMNYQDLMKKLSDINAKDNCILIDACYSGQASDYVKEGTNFDGNNVDLVTGSNGKKLTWNDYEKVADTGKKWKGYSVYSRNFFMCFGNPEADKNNDSTTSFIEAFNWVKNQKPKMVDGRDIDSLQCPAITSVAQGDVDETKKEISFRDNDVIASNFSVDSFFDIAVRLEVDTKDRTITDNRIIGLSKNRMWTINSDLENGTFTVDLLFQFRDQYENLSPGSKQIIGMCWREDESDDWKPQYPSVHNTNDNTVLCGKTDHFSDWVAGIIVEEPANSVDSKFLVNGIEYGPNPFKDLFHFDFTLDKPETFSIEIVNVTGKVIDRLPMATYSQGRSTVNLDGSKYVTGTYYCRFISDKNIRTIKIVKQQ